MSSSIAASSRVEDDFDMQALVSRLCDTAPTNTRAAASLLPTTPSIPTSTSILSSPLFTYRSRNESAATFVIGMEGGEYSSDISFSEPASQCQHCAPAYNPIGLQISYGQLPSLGSEAGPHKCRHTEAPFGGMPLSRNMASTSSPSLADTKSAKHSPYNGPSSKTRVCRYYLSRNNNHFGKTCSYIHPCKSLVVDGECKHGRRCTDDHICLQYLYHGDTVPHGCGKGEMCMFLHVKHEADRASLLDMFRDWIAVKRGASSAWMYDATATPSPHYPPTPYLERPACPFWYADTQSGCKAGPDCIYNHTGQFQLATRPLPNPSQLKFAERAWEKRMAMDHQSTSFGAGSSSPLIKWEDGVRDSSATSLASAVSHLSLEHYTSPPTAAATGTPAYAPPASYYHHPHSIAPPARHSLPPPHLNHGMFAPSSSSNSSGDYTMVRPPPPGLPARRSSNNSNNSGGSGNSNNITIHRGGPFYVM